MKIIKNTDELIHTNQKDMLMYYRVVEDDYVLSGETDVTSAYNLHIFQINGKIDYVKTRDSIDTHLLPNWNELTPTEIDYSSIYCKNVNPYDIIGYLMMVKGMDQLSATDYYYELRSKDIRNAAICYTNRLSEHHLTKIAIKFLSANEIFTFQDALQNFIPYVQNVGLLGIEYGDGMDGIMDYIESTNTYAEAGLMNYTINEPYTLQDMVDELKGLIVYGNYND